MPRRNPATDDARRHAAALADVAAARAAWRADAPAILATIAAERATFSDADFARLARPIRAAIARHTGKPGSDTP